MKEPSITFIAGPTASGKSALALELANKTGAIIINADSQQLYTALRILTARPSEADEACAEHRLYGVADAAEIWSVGRWSRAALSEIRKAETDARPVLVVGGTGLYFHALTRGLADIPAVPEPVRDAVAAEFDALGEASTRARLKDVDPLAAGRIASGDRQRLVRAMAVHRHTGRPLSDWQANTHPLLPDGSWAGLVLEPDRAALYQACDLRVDRMLHAGALDEVRSLLNLNLPPEIPIMKAVGLRELAEVVSGAQPIERGADAMRQATRNYAKRQLTWFRNQMPDWPRRLLPQKT